MPKKLTTEEFIKRAKELHGNKYDYLKSVYNGFYEKVCIICPEHGEFWQTPNCHLRGKGCPKCSRFSLKSVGAFIKQAKEVHGGKYDYSKIEYKGNKIKICIVCPEHGEFWQTPNSHLIGHGCPKCAAKKTAEENKISLEEFVKRAKKTHGDKYDYSKVKYDFIKDKVEIICPIHGSFVQSGHAHLNGHGCPKCNCLWKSTKQFIEEAKKIHGDRYDYSKVEYVNNKTPITIICPRHGEFKQLPTNHLKGCNCPKCACSKIEDKIIQLLNKHNIKFKHREHFDWLGKQHLDFYLPDYNMAIECQGRQHFKPISVFGGEHDFISIVERDKIKNKACKENNVKLIYYTNIKEYNSFLGEELIKEESDLLNKIIVPEKEK